MKKKFINVLQALALVLGIAACASRPTGTGWVKMIEGGIGLENFVQVGDANWRAENGVIVADRGKGGFLVSKQSYRDFEIYAEFWVAANTNTGVFLRSVDPMHVGVENSYEVNVWDLRPDPKYGTGSIVDFASVPVPSIYLAGGKWNTLEISAEGNLLTVKLNGVVTARANDGTFPSGPFALQYGFGRDGAVGGPVKWRKVAIRPL